MDFKQYFKEKTGLDFPKGKGPERALEIAMHTSSTNEDIYIDLLSIFRAVLDADGFLGIEKSSYDRNEIKNILGD